MVWYVTPGFPESSLSPPGIIKDSGIGDQPASGPAPGEAGAWPGTVADITRRGRRLVAEFLGRHAAQGGPGGRDPLNLAGLRSRN